MATRCSKHGPYFEAWASCCRNHLIAVQIQGSKYALLAKRIRLMYLLRAR